MESNVLPGGAVLGGDVPAPKSRWLRACVLFTLLIALGWHFAMTIAFCFPLTPVTVAIDPFVQRYIHPYLQQNWSFFAPNPPSMSEYVLVEYRYRTSDGAVHDSDWINLSHSLNVSSQRNRLTPLEIVQLVADNAYSDASRSDIFKDGKLDSAHLEKEIASGTQPPSLHTLERLGMAFYPYTGLGGSPVELRLGFLRHQFPRFTHRMDPDSADANNSVVLLPYVPFEPVAAM